MTKLKLFITLAASLASCSSLASLYPSKWDTNFKDAMVFLPVGTDWRLLKAQCYQESRLNPLAKSPVGAMGLCQFMPATWSDMKARDASLTSPWIPELSILAAGKYMGQLNRAWSSRRHADDRYKLALASYNGGMGNLLKAQRLCNGPVAYDEIAACLPDVTGKHSEETLGYVRLIWSKWWPAMRAD